MIAASVFHISVLVLLLIARFNAFDVCFAQPPGPSAAQREAVASALRALQPGDSHSEQVAEAGLIHEGEALVPALREALTGAEGIRRDVLDGALVRLTWKRNPREDVLRWIGAATGQPAATWDPANGPATISDAAVTRALPGYRFTSVHFRMYPLARQTPPPLNAQNLFAVSKAGVVTHLLDPEALAAFFRDHADAPARPEKQAQRDLVFSWLRCSEEFSWDGFFQFTIPREGMSVRQSGDGWTGEGDALVTPKGGDRGKIHAALVFDAKGRIVKVDETRTVQAGARPICQATKLLDRDPIVRAMAEQALLVMGVSARDYLAERRARAAPPLQHAIDLVWLRILERERAVGNVPPRTDLRTGP